ncbi:hypothetical protein SK128_000929 [Halocaridina rubra]|uniref:Alpha-glucosidase n=1 Tax=Halocaridina rubra TaxID=373956 RepID=A0AAN9A4M5_HALRR
MVEFNLFGIPYIGADICGFFGDSTEELCERWMELGAFYPYSRNHNTLGAKDHDPGLWPSVAASSYAAMRVRYTLLPYLYTLHYLASTEGHTVVRPLFFEFPENTDAQNIDTQFLWGSWLMITPVLEEGSTFVRPYFPKGIWYDYYNGTAFVQEVASNRIVLAPRSHIPVFVRGGGIIPTQRPRVNTELSRKEPLGLIVAPDHQEQAEGTFYWDEGDSLDPLGSGKYFTADMIYDNGTLHWIVTHAWDGMNTMALSDIRIFGVPDRPTQIIIDGKRWKMGDWHYNIYTKVLELFDLEIPAQANFTLTWNSQMDFKIPCPMSYKDWNENIEITKEMCTARNCDWDGNHEIQCSVPSADAYGYEYASDNVEQTEKGFRLFLKKRGVTLYGPDVKEVTFEVFQYSDDTLRFKFYDSINDRYEVPAQLNLPLTGIQNPLYELVYPTPKSGNMFYFYVVRKDTGSILFDTRIGGLTFSDQFLSLTALLPSKNIYGMGENTHHSFRHNMSQKIWPIFARDQPPIVDSEQRNLYGAHPYYQCIENDGKAHGVLLLNSNALDYQMLDYPAISYRTIGGVLDFFMVLGPDPEMVVAQYTFLIHRPMIPPYWALGFQLCRYGYASLEELQQAVNRTRDANIPQDVQYGDIDYMDRRMSFTYDVDAYDGFPEYITEVKDQGLRFIVILDPAINAEMPLDEYETHERAVAADAYIKWAPETDPDDIEFNNGGNSSYMLGYVWPENRTAFPSFFKSSSQNWWIEEIKEFYATIEFDGLWIDMNEPANFGTNEEKPWNWPEDWELWSLQCPESTWDDPPYVTKAGSWSDANRMADKTLCLAGIEERDSPSAPYRHYDVHNLYGWSQTQPIYTAARLTTGKRGLVVSRSTFPGSGHWAGHWLGDNRSIWPDMKHSIIGMLEFNLFGIPYIGADICGFFEDTTPELCERWMELGAFYPYSRNHNSKDSVDQDPGLWQNVAESSKKALEIRYRLLPYLYTLFYHAHAHGNTVIRALLHE